MKKYFLTIILFVATVSIYAVPPAPAPEPIPLPGVPVSGGILFLVASGIVYGVAKLRK